MEALLLLSYFILTMSAAELPMTTDLQPCELTKYGCCPDGITSAQGLDQDGCPAGELCQLPPAAGMCRASFPRYFFNSATGTCELFIYGGCGGNGNRFETIEECQMVCSNGNTSENDVSVDIGSSIQLDCGVPDGAIFKSWSFISEGKLINLNDFYIPGITIEKEEGKAVLSIDDIKQENAGSYICEVQDSSSQQIATTEINLVIKNTGTHTKQNGGSADQTTPFENLNFEKMMTQPNIVDDPDFSGSDDSDSFDESLDGKNEKTTPNSSTGPKSKQLNFDSPDDDDDDDDEELIISEHNGKSPTEDTAIVAEHDGKLDKPSSPTNILSSASDDEDGDELEISSGFGVNEPTTHNLGQQSAHTDVTTPISVATHNLDVKVTDLPDIGEPTTFISNDITKESMKVESTDSKPTESHAAITDKPPASTRYLTTPQVKDNTHEKTTPLIVPDDTIDIDLVDADESNVDIVDVPDGGCTTAKFGCCSDGESYSQGPNFEGCPDTKTGYNLLHYPRDFVASKYLERGNDVELYLSWSPPTDDAVIDFYTVYFTSDLDLPLDSWETVDATQSYHRMSFRKGTPIFFKIRGYNRVQKSPISPTYVYSFGEDEQSQQLIGGCYGTRYGCCDDGLTSAAGYNRAGCPEQEVVTMKVIEPDVFESTEPTTTPTTTTTTTTEKPSASELSPPVNFKVIKDAVAADRVAIKLRWEDPQKNYPISSYILRFTNDVSIPQDQWRRHPLSEPHWTMALRRESVFYFTIAAASADGVETEQSPIYSFSTEDQISKLYAAGDCSSTTYGCCPDGKTAATGSYYSGCAEISIDGGCAGTQFGCCSDGRSSARGPDRIGCPNDRQPCDTTRFGCCLDGETEASGTDFEGCPDQIPLPETAESTEVNPECEVQKEMGPCTKYAVQWYYDSTAKTCGRFWYGGCGGNFNRFNSEAECKEKCLPSKRTTSAVSPTADTCFQATIVGPCRGNFQRWTFSQKTRRCEQFTYGGCQGNENRFTSPSECESRCSQHENIQESNICALPKDVGPCYALKAAWYFDNTYEVCREFFYGGCGGNDNRFSTEKECQTRCKPASKDPKDICLLPSETGSCKASISVFAYNSEAGGCEIFIYGGCGGNGNRFNDRETCMKTCGPQKTVQGNTCQVEKDAGPCPGYNIRWFYNSRSSRCERFIYGGCQGNTNNFLTQEECEGKCVQQETTTSAVKPTDVCSLSPDSGNCYAYFEMWYYNFETGNCDPFVYGGCGGNENRFRSEEECLGRCSQKLPDERIVVQHNEFCSLDRDSGDCNGYEIKWYYDKENAICRRFIYTGCGGNNNRFDDGDACKSSCEGEESTNQRRVVVTTPRALTVIPTTTTAPTTTRKGTSFEEKSGSCPAEDTLTDCPVLQPCGDDSDCPYGKKCCWSNDCGGVCAAELSQNQPAAISNKEANKYTGSVGSKLDLFCNFIGSPRPTVVWYKNRRPLAVLEDSTNYEVSDDGTLTILNVTASDAAEFICRVYNGLGSPDHLYVAVDILGPVFIKKDTENYESQRGETIVIPCRAEGVPRPQINWLFNGQLIEDGIGADNSLTIRNLSPVLAGEYRCIGENSFSRAERTVFITVSEPLYLEFAPHNKTFVAGDTMTLTCDAQSYPTPNVLWLKDEKPLKPDGRISINGERLVVTNLVASDTGMYSCKASNGKEAMTVGTSIQISETETTTKSSIPQSCTDRPEVANCLLIVKHNYCAHPVYRHFCCRSCLMAGKMARLKRWIRW